MEPKTGDLIKIGEEKFQILNVLDDVDKDDNLCKKFELHRIGCPALLPTHVLTLCENKKEGLLREVTQEKPTAEHPRTRGLFSDALKVK